MAWLCLDGFICCLSSYPDNSVPGGDVIGWQEILIIIYYLVVVSPLPDKLTRKYDSMNFVFEFQNKQRKGMK